MTAATKALTPAEIVGALGTILALLEASREAREAGQSLGARFERVARETVRALAMRVADQCEGEVASPKYLAVFGVIDSIREAHNAGVENPWAARDAEMAASFRLLDLLGLTP